MKRVTTNEIKDIALFAVADSMLQNDSETEGVFLNKETSDKILELKDALSVGDIQDYTFLTDKILIISAKGRGSRQMCRMDKFGFTRTSAKASKSVKGFQTGDIVKAIVPTGSKQGEYLGRVIVRSKGSFSVVHNSCIVDGIGYKYCHLVQRGDGYSYNYKERDFLSGKNNRASVAKI